MALHNTFKTTALHHADGVHKIAGGEQRNADDIAGFHVFGEITKFLDAFDRRAILLLDMAEKRLGQALFLLVVKAELHGIVAIFARLSFDLQHAVGASQHDRDGNDFAGSVIDARVTEFFS
jgi:hypothetical protein